MPKGGVFKKRVGTKVCIPSAINPRRLKGRGKLESVIWSEKRYRGKFFEASTLQSKRDLDRRVEAKIWKKAVWWKAQKNTLGFVKCIEIDRCLYFRASGRGVKDVC